jgi:hypothetical protein
VRVFEGVAAAWVAAAVTACSLDCAFAEEGANGAEFNRYLLFSGFDLWRSGGFIHGGVLWSPGGLEREGFTLKLLTGGGDYRYQSRGTEIRGESGLVSVMPGWRIKSGRLEITAVAGADLQVHRLTPDDPGNRTRGTHAGVRAGFDLWYQPSDEMMVAAGVSASTIGPNYWSRLATGWRIFDRIWVGPEAVALGGSNYQQLRLGIHATSFKTGPLEWSAGVGYTRDSDHRDGVYGRVGVLTRQ